jgi:hypothetical protein
LTAPRNSHIFTRVKMELAMGEQRRYTAFAGNEQIASGRLEDMALAVRAHLAQEPHAAILIFDDATGGAIDLDLRGSDAEALERLKQHPAHGLSRKPGRPKLGVVSREVTLLPRHWDWLNAQPGGASVALRKLVDEARATKGDRDRTRQAREVAYRFASAMAGNAPGYEEAMRALFAGNEARFQEMIGDWPAHVRSHVALLAKNGFAAAAPDDAPDNSTDAS